ncbi:DgyrCDS1737 [Dimorphilus gyrociliatus]|uniref:DgyrCDS1737 n=1 Tax=Dimorphilus gyrociliatus TaxID=2664684 RepID=A0A7I8V9N9_9ANNE|nr:DgyrCDS1737 [Dimorphilus gyrociliatus]
MCGGHKHISVYVAPLPIDELQIISRAGGIHRVWDKAEFKFDIAGGPPQVLYRVDYGDGDGFTGTNVTNMLSKYFGLPGEYIVTGEASDVHGLIPASKAATYILVQAPAKYVKIECPESVVTYSEFRCNVSVVSGSFMNIKVDWNDGIVESFPIADSVWFGAGPAIRQHSDIAESSVGGKTYVLPNSQFEETGVILAFEMWATQAGPIELIILRPVCGPSMSYCFKTNKCTSSPCEEYGSVTCSTGEQFCPVRGVCLASASSSCPSASNRYSTSLPVSYEVIKKWAYTIPSEGYNVMEITDGQFEVEMGDIIGFVTVGAGRIGTRSKDVTEVGDKVIATGTVTVGSVLSDLSQVTLTSPDERRHLLRAAASKPVNIIVFHTYTTSRQFDIRVNISNEYIPGFDTTSLGIYAQMGIDQVIADHVAVGGINKEVTFNILPHLGTNVTYRWNFGDSLTTVETTERTIKYTFNARNTYNVTVVAYNKLMSKTNVSTITIQGIVADVEVFSSVGETNKNHNFWLNMTGTDYVCNWSFGDGNENRSTWLSIPSNGGIMSHNYTIHGVLTLNVTCWNTISRDETLIPVYIYEPITNVVLTPSGTIRGDPYMFVIEYETGTDVSAELSVQSLSIDLAHNTALKQFSSSSQPSIPTVGRKLITGAVWNPLSRIEIKQNFSIEERITGFTAKVTPDKYEIIQGDSLDFTAQLFGGTSIRLVFDYGDGTSDSHSIPDLTRWTPGDEKTFTHKFSKPGIFTVNITASNFQSFFKSFEITVLNTVDNMTLESSSPAPFVEPEGLVYFWFLPATFPPVNAEVRFLDWGDNTTTTNKYVPFTMDKKTYMHPYKSTGNYNVKVHVKNKLSALFLTVTVKLQIPITNMILDVNPKHAPIGLPVNVGVRMDSGLGVRLIWHWGDGTNSDYKTRHGTTPGDYDYAEHIFSSIGTYKIAVTGYNDLGNTTIEYVIVAQHPVTDSFQFTSNAPLSYPPGDVDFTLTYPPLEILPTDASFTIDYGDEVTTKPAPLAFSSPSRSELFPYEYKKANGWIATIKIFNLASSKTLTASGGVFEKIANLKGKALFRPEVPVDSPDIVGFGPEENVFPFHRDVKFFMTSFGTVVKYLVSVSSGSALQICNKTTSPVTVSFPAVGTYDVRVTAWNPIGSVDWKTKIIIAEAILDLDVSDGLIRTKAGQSKEFKVVFGSIGTNTCLKLNFGDGSADVAYGTTADCNAAYSMTPKGSLTNPLKVFHVFDKNDYYTLKADAKSLLNSEVRTFSFTVSAADCAAPLVEIQDAVTKFSDARKVYRKDSFRLVGLTSIQCTATLDNVKTWSVEEIDSSTGVTKKKIDLSSLKSSETSELNIPARYLNYGLYKIFFNVKMDSKGIPDQSTFTSSAITYVQIRASPLIVQVMEGGMNVITRGFGQDITLDAAKNSIDPDNPENKQFDKFFWICKRSDGEYPRTKDGILAEKPLTRPYTLSELALLTDKTDRRGCFASQPPGKINITGGKLTFNTKNMLENETYNFYVKVFKGARSAYSYLHLRVVTGNPPNVLLECPFGGLCTPTSLGQRVNPTERLALRGTCTNCAEGQIYKHEWSLYREGLNNAWIRVGDFTQHIRGAASPEISISSSLFTKYLKTSSKVLNYRVKLALTPINGGTVGVSYTNLIINAPPARGSCSIEPKVGYVVQDTWNLTCKHWYDADGISYYQVVTKMKGYDAENTLYVGSSGITKLNVPQGPADDSYKVSVYVRITDGFGATVTKLVGIVQSKPLGSAALKKELKASEKIIKTLAADGDLRKSSVVYMKYASAMNTDREGDESYYANYGVEVSPVSTRLNIKTKPIVNDKVNETVREEKEAEKSKERNFRSEQRQTMLVSLASMPANTMKDLQLKASTLSEITKSPDELTRVSQQKLIESVEDSVKVLDKLVNEFAKTELLLCVTQLISTCADALESFGVTANYPLESDILESIDSVYYEYDTTIFKKRKRLDGINKDKQRRAFRVETNSLNQEEHAGVFEQKTRPAINSLIGILNKRVVLGEDPLVIRTNNFVASLIKNTADNTLAEPFVYGRTSLKLPSWCSLTNKVSSACNPKEIISARVLSYGFNPLTHVSNKDSVPPSISTIDVSILDSDGKEIPIRNSSEKIKLELELDPKTDDVKAAYINAKLGKQSLLLHKFNVNLSDSNINMEVIPDNPKVQFIGFLRYEKAPNFTETDVSFDYHFLFPSKLSDAIKNYKSVLDGKTTGNRVGVWYLGLRQLNTTDYDKYIPQNIPSYPLNGEGEFTTNYTIKISAVSCSFFDESARRWKNNGLNAKLQSSTRLACDSDHLTLFGGSLVVQPNTIDWSYVLKNLSFASNPTLYITEITIFVIFILAAIWARRKDKQDVMKLGVSPLKDNAPDDKYLYEIIFYTGMRKNAGTDSNVQFILSGEYDETDVRTVEEKERKIFRRGGVDAFLMATPSPLGQFSYMRIWHDNTGKGKYASWFLKHVVVVDLQTKEKSYFLANRWFAVEEDDGQVDRLLPVAGKEQMTEFGQQFSANTKKNLNDGHLWFSVVSRPPQSRFTRLQRVSCCLLLLYSTMLANAMFYGRGESQGGAQNALQLGPFALSPSQIYIGVVSNLIVFPVNLLVVTLFRKSRKKKKRTSRLQEAIQKNQQLASKKSKLSLQSLSVWETSTDDKPLEEVRPSETTPPPPHDTERTCSPSSSSAPIITQKKQKKPFSFPWWVCIVSWIILWLSVLTCAAVVTAYGITFGDDKSKKWITSMLISFIASIFFTQPIKVILVAVLVSLIFKNTNIDESEDEEDEEDYVLASDEQWLHKPDEHYAKPRKVPYKPPNPEVLEKARAERLKELEMYNVIREIAFYALFLWLLIIIGYSYRDTNSGTMKTSLVNHFIDVSKKNVKMVDFTEVKNKSHLLHWMENSLAPSLRAGDWYNGQKAFGQIGFASDRVSRIMGYATLRQLRVKPRQCHPVSQMRPLLRECNTKYSISDEDRTAHGTGWSKLNATTKAPPHYVYRSAEELEGYPYWAIQSVYPGGGYVIGLNMSLLDMQAKIRELRDELWIDRYSRALFIEFSVYNTGVNLFGICTLVAELIPDGGIVTSYRIEAVNLLSYFSGAMLFQVICEVFFVLFIVFFLVKEGRNLYKQRKLYFKQFWNYVEIGIIVFSISGICMYFYKLVQTNKILKKFKDTHGNGYMKLQYVGYWHEILMYMVGWTVFLATLKFIRLLRFNKRMSMLAATLKVGAKPLSQFAMLFLVVFFAYAQFFFLIYSQLMQTFATVIKSAETCLQMLLGRFNFNAMQEASPLLGPVFFFFYVITVAYILINMFLVILNESFSQVRRDLSKQSNDYELVEFMIRRLKTWTGMDKKKKGSKPVEPDYKSATKALQPGMPPANLDNFPEKVDRLLNCISKVYFDSDRFAAIFENGTGREQGKEGMKRLMQQHRIQKSLDMASKNIQRCHFPTLDETDTEKMNF